MAELLALVALMVSSVNLAYFVVDFKRRFDPRFQVIVIDKHVDVALGDFRHTLIVRNRGFAADVMKIAVQKRFGLNSSSVLVVWEGMEEVGPTSKFEIDLDRFEDGVSCVFWITYNGNRRANCLVHKTLEADLAISDLS
jgi:hypothetical protein